MSQIRKNKSFGRNNNINHYFYLFCLLPLLSIMAFVSAQTQIWEQSFFDIQYVDVLARFEVENRS